METNPTYEHKGVRIELLAGSGEFAATIDGKVVTKPSLAAIKKVIDDGNKDRGAYSPPMSALLWHHVNYRSRDEKPFSQTPIEEFRTKVVRIAKSRGRSSWNSYYEFETADGKSYRVLIQDTPEAFAALMAYYEHEEYAIRVRAELEAESNRLRQAVPTIKADEEAKRKGMK